MGKSTDKPGSLKPELANLPSISRVLEAASESSARWGRGSVSFAARREINNLREQIKAGRLSEIPSVEQLSQQIEISLGQLLAERRVVNASGILLHTGLGRAPLSKAGLRVLQNFDHYVCLEVELESGERNQRERKVEEILQQLLPCEAATVVNNCAAATFLALRAVALGREVLVSRGQLIEIGGSFRMPDVMASSGCLLKEVGTTNKTHLFDYERAITENTGALVHVHASNYRIRGFADSPTVSDLAPLAKKHQLPLIDDLGSGAIVKLSQFALPDEYLVQESLGAGADLVLFSGDKLLSGPQAGIVCGEKNLIAKLRAEPFFRMFRPDKLTLALLEVTLLHFLNGDYRSELPLYKMLSISIDELEKRASAILKALNPAVAKQLEILPTSAYTGGGALPDCPIPSVALKIKPAAKPEVYAYKLRQQAVPVFCRLQEESLIFDLRTLLEGDEELLVSALNSLFC